MIRIEHATKRFSRAKAIDDVSLHVEPGDSVALWGANGAGKTTLIRCALGLLRFEGSISIAGHDVWKQGKLARRLVGYVPQELGFYDELSVADALSFFARLKGLSHVHAPRVLESVALAGQERKRIRDLSGGMKQRLALALALLGDPPVLVLDEVTASLDAVGRAEFVRLLERLSGSGRTLLFASHRLDEVSALARRVARLEKGRLASVAPVAKFVAHADTSTLLHITIRAGAREQALACLRAGGFSPQKNGVGVLVPVQPQHKAAPFRVLADAQIPVDDFEILSAHARPQEPAP